MLKDRPILNSNFPICLAPMVGLSHVALREVIQSYLPTDAKTIWPTEMLNSRKIPIENLATTPETMRSPLEENLTPQILGNEEIPIKESVRILENWGAAAIDINMGCPVQKALKHNYGVALMGDPKYAAEVVRMTKANAKIPISVKLRAVGSQKELPELYDFVRGLREAGTDWICLHPRTAAQKRRGQSDWSQIFHLHQEFDFPIIGNGDVQTADDAEQMLTETQCEMAMSGRGLAARPWMLWQLGRRWGFADPKQHQGRPMPTSAEEEGQEYGYCLLALIKASQRYFTEAQALRKVRFYVRMTSVWLDFGNALTGVVAKSRTTDEMLDLVEVFFKAPISMASHTELRQ